MTQTTEMEGGSSSKGKGPFLGSGSPLPLLVDTATDEDSLVFEDDSVEESDASTPTSEFEASQKTIEPSPSSAMINHESVSSDRDVFLSILQKKLKHHKHKSTHSSKKKKKSSRESSVKPIAENGPYTASPPSTPTAKHPTSSHSIVPKKRHYKNIILLLQPRHKTFELVEIRYESAAATIGDMIRMIPQRATVAEFRNQAYTGFVRPKDGMEFIDFQEIGADRIDHHEVLVAINQGCTGSQALLCSQPILANRRMVKLLGKADKHKKKHHDKLRHQGSPKKSRAVSPLMPIQEQPAAEEATQIFTASTPRRKTISRRQKQAETSEKLDVPVENNSTAISLLTGAVSSDDSSVSSGNTLSYSASQTEYHVVTQSKRNRRRKRAKRRAVAIKCVAGVLFCLVTTYLMDSSASVAASASQAQDAAMGITGLGQVALLLFAFVMMQRHAQKNQDKRLLTTARRHVGFARSVM